MIRHHREFSEAEKEKITKDFLPFIKYTAYRFAWRLPPQLTVDDLVSVGIVGLLEALTRYREGEAKLNTFVEYRIKGAMLDELRNHSPVPKSLKKKVVSIKKAHLELERELGRQPGDEEVAGSLGISLDEYYRTLTSSHCTDTIRFEDFGDKCNEDERLDLTECIADTRARSPLEILEEKHRSETLAKLIEELPEKEKIVLSLYYWEELTMKEIGRIMHLSEGRVCQLHSQAVIRMKSKLTTYEEVPCHVGEGAVKHAPAAAEPRPYERALPTKGAAAGRVAGRVTA